MKEFEGINNQDHKICTSKKNVSRIKVAPALGSPRFEGARDNKFGTKDNRVQECIRPKL